MVDELDRKLQYYSAYSTCYTYEQRQYDHNVTLGHLPQEMS